MRHLLLLLALPVLFGCDAHTNEPDEASAVIYIDGERMDASASVTTRELDGTAYQMVSLEMAGGSRIELLAPTFEEGRFIKEHEADASFPFGFSYVAGGDRPRIYMPDSGTVEISIASPTVVAGAFEFDTYDGLSSCAGCEAAKGPRVQGRFKAVRGEG
ncbi:MAG: hypothetical protein ACE5G0_10480 [Rhodothermales bacterium]